uniref:NADH-ubiquinone oxidoreductase chain 3 n=1 Tax=Diplodiscus japonicus TaxID=1895467 RepID=A0A977WLF0_9TREM|nr:NADH dehydrogenase subunit 3 [Diplodiscus japonicus]UXL86283.1 NADH dehydrogenase subunit 3 [Diplodiscus japonicus]
MSVLLGFVLLFLLVFVLVLVFHAFVWNINTMGGAVRTWVSSYECGFISQRVVENFFSYTYFVLLVFFVIFDLEVSLLLNMPLQGVLFKNMSYYVLFLVLLGVGFTVEVNSGYVVWSY